VRWGELSARELVQTSLERIKALNPQVNAFVDAFAAEALAEAVAIAPGDPRPFAGVLTAIKNKRAVAGRRLTFGASLLGDFVARVIARFVIVGTTTLPQYGILPWAETVRFGATRNPWYLTRTTPPRLRARRRVVGRTAGRAVRRHGDPYAGEAGHRAVDGAAVRGFRRRPVCAQAAHDAGRLLGSLGHEVRVRRGLPEARERRHRARRDLERHGLAVGLAGHLAAALHAPGRRPRRRPPARRAAHRPAARRGHAARARRTAREVRAVGGDVCR